MNATALKKKLLFMLYDGVLIAASIALAYAWKARTSDATQNLIHVYWIPGAILLRWVLFSYFRLYDFSKLETSLDQIYYLFWAGTLAAGGDWLALLVMKNYHLAREVGVSRQMILNSWGLILIGTASWRIYRRSSLRRRGQHIHRVAIVGAGPTALRVREEIRRFAHSELGVVGFVSTGTVAPDARLSVIGQLDAMDEPLAAHRVDELIVAPEPEERSRLLELLSRCEQLGNGIQVRLHPDLAELYVGHVALSQLAGLPLISVPDRCRYGLHLVIKRAMDIGVAFVGLVLLVVPGALVALGIKLEGCFRPEARGPVFFVQERIGRDRRRFRLVKFRTMIRTAEEGSGPLLARKSDPRITRTGWLLRRTGIDELPQLWNILKGEMSLVGPRPERGEFVERFLAEEPAYALRFRLRPGITGLAQIHGHYDSSVASKLRYDLVYAAKVSLLLDMKILFRTVQVVLTGRKIK